MTNSLDRFPLEDALVKENTLFMSAIWVSFMENFYQNLTDYLSKDGFFLPNLTQKQIKAITTPVNGQLLYNTDKLVDSPQFYQVSTKSWRTILFI